MAAAAAVESPLMGYAQQPAQCNRFRSNLRHFHRIRVCNIAKVFRFSLGSVFTGSAAQPLNLTQLKWFEQSTRTWTIRRLWLVNKLARRNSLVRTWTAYCFVLQVHRVRSGQTGHDFKTPNISMVTPSHFKSDSRQRTHDAGHQNSLNTSLRPICGPADQSGVSKVSLIYPNSISAEAVAYFSSVWRFFVWSDVWWPASCWQRAPVLAVFFLPNIVHTHAIHTYK